MKGKNFDEVSRKYPKFVSYPKIPYLEEKREIQSKEGYFFEKIDGALVQVRNTGRVLLGGSKSNYLIGKRTKYSWFPKFLRWMYSNKSLKNLPTSVIMYGEWLQPTTIEYDEKYLDKFYFIDLAYVENDEPRFFDFEEAVDYLNFWNIENIEILPPIWKGPFRENLIEKIENMKSQLRDGKMEGFVFKNYWTQEFVKHLDPEYSEIRRQEKTLEKRYINLPRIRKALVRLKDEKNNPKPTLEQLALEVASDIYNESKIYFDPQAVKAIIRIKGYYNPKGDNPKKRFSK